MKRNVLVRVLVVAAIGAVALTSWGNTVQAAGKPAPQSDAAIVTANGISGQDPKFVALKKAFRVHSGVTRGQAKGTKSQAYISATPMSLPSTASTATTVNTGTWGNCSNCAELPILSAIPNIFEPGPGTDKHNIVRPNFGYNTPNYDDTSLSKPHHYIDQNFYDLCGPGAADVALWYWPWPPNAGSYTATDPWNNTTTTWDGADLYDVKARSRGYMVNLAWKINPGNQGGALGLMQGGTGTTDTRERQGLNWEASGETSVNYFYVIDTGSASALHNAIQSDIVNSNVPVVLLVNAAYLPNWPQGTFNPTNHYITIIGYNDSTGQYAYTDTCGKSTNCGSNNDGHILVGSQSQIFTATYEWIW